MQNGQYFADVIFKSFSWKNFKNFGWNLFHWQYNIIVSGHYLALNRRRRITWNNNHVPYSSQNMCAPRPQWVNIYFHHYFEKSSWTGIKLQVENVAGKSFSVFDRFKPNLVCPLGGSVDDHPPTVKKSDNSKWHLAVYLQRFWFYAAVDVTFDFDVLLDISSVALTPVAQEQQARDDFGRVGPDVVQLLKRQNGCHFADDNFKRIFSNENVRISIKISLKFVPRGPINNNPSLVQIMAWRRSGDNPLSEPVMESLLAHICVTRPQWVNSLWSSDVIWRQRSWSTLAQVMACCLTAPSHYLNQCGPGLAQGCCDFKFHFRFREVWKFRHNWPKKQHKMGLDMSNVLSPLYTFPSPFLLGDLVNANPVDLSSVRSLDVNHYHKKIWRCQSVTKDCKLQFKPNPGFRGANELI